MKVCLTKPTPKNGPSTSKQKQFYVQISPIIVVGLLVGVFLFCFGGVVFAWHKVTQQQESGEINQRMEVLAAPVETYVRTFQYLVKPGDTFASILTGFGVPHDRAIAYYRSFSTLGLSSLHPGDSIVGHFDNKGTILKQLSLLSGLECWYNLTCTDNGFNVHKSMVPLETYTCVVKGVITRSLSEDLNELGVGDEIISRFAEIFGWDINFFMDPRKGDSAKIVFEKRFANGKFVGYGDILAATYINTGKTYEAFLHRDQSGRPYYYDAAGKALQKEFLKAPLHFTRISSGFSFHRKHPILGIVRPHLGVDYAAPTGTPVVSPAAGTVIFAGWDGGFGKVVKIRHGGSFQTVMGHLNSIAAGVSTGKRIAQGEQIGTVGSTGLATGPHLDYRISRNGVFINPITMASPSLASIGDNERMSFATLVTKYKTIFDCRFAGDCGLYVMEIVSVVPEKKAISHQVSSSYMPRQANGG